MKHLLFYLLLFGFSQNFMYGQLFRSTSKVGTTAAQFLKIGAGARAIGMGDAYTGISDDIFAVYWNPAGIVHSEYNGEAAFNNAQWLADISYNFAAASLNLGDFGAIFTTLTALGVPEDKVRTEAFPEGDGRYWNASMLSIGMGYARKLTDKFSIGFHLKYIREAIWNTSSQGVAIDIGTYYISPFNDMIIAASVSNFGSKMQLDGRNILFNIDPDNDPSSGPRNILSQYDMGKFDLPLTFRLGVAMDVLKENRFRVTTALDATHPNDNTEYLNVGVEAAYDEMFMVRAGYKSLFLRDSEQDITFGGGVSYPINSQLRIVVNYGWAAYGRLENVQFVDLGIKF